MIAVFSDIHANADNLERALGEMKGAEAILFLGDAVGYRKNPESTLRLLRDRVDLAVQGNHDAAAVGQFDQFLEMIPPWLADTLDDVAGVSEELFAWLATRKKVATFSGLQLVHGSFRDPWMEFLTPEVADEHFLLQSERISLVGHTHKALAIADDGVTLFYPREEGPTLYLSPAQRWILNPGSLGVTKSGPSWMSLDLEKNEARWHFL